MSASGINSLNFAVLLQAYREGRFGPCDVAAEVLERIKARGEDGVWLHRIGFDDVMARAQALEALSADQQKGLALYGLPFAVKDNIDVAGLPTTAACPDYAYKPAENAPVVQALLDAGAILIGKTNLDQFATGLVGVRTPYGVCANPFDADYIPGGSSAGSAVAVTTGLVSFALGTDTAGSGRIPAAFNNIIGLKPTRGLLSARGVVPACRSLDCVSIFTLTTPDAHVVLEVVRGHDKADSYSRTDAGRALEIKAEGLESRTIAVPRDQDLEFFGDQEAARLFDQAIEAVSELGAEIIRIDFSPFLETARLLYEGPWVAERYAAVEPFLRDHPDAFHPVTRQIIENGSRPTASDAFKAFYQLEALKRTCQEIWQTADVLMTPTAGTIYKIVEVESDPVALNSNLGYYTNFLNLLDMCGIAVPASMRKDGLPFGITLAAPALLDADLLPMADALHRAAKVTLGATGIALPDQDRTLSVEEQLLPDHHLLGVCGAHMSGLPLNRELTQLGARFVETTATAPEYQLFALEHLTPLRPGLVRSANGYGRSIKLEIWQVPSSQVGKFLAGIAAPLGLGTLMLSDGRFVQGFLCEAHATGPARDITDFGGWRAFLEATTATAPPSSSSQNQQLQTAKMGE